MSTIYPLDTAPFSLVARSSLIFGIGLTQLSPFCMFVLFQLLLDLCMFGNYDANLSDLRTYLNFHEFSWFCSKDTTPDMEPFWKNHGWGLEFSEKSLKLGHFLENFVWFQPQWIGTSAIIPYLKNHFNICCCNERTLVLTFSPLSECLKKVSALSTKLISVLWESYMLQTTFQLLKERMRLLLLL